MNRKTIFRLLMALVFAPLTTTAQDDIGVVTLAQPVSDCAMTTADISVDIFNFGDDITAASVQVSYTINGELSNQSNSDCRQLQHQ